MSWASEKAVEVFHEGRPTRQFPFGSDRLSTIERAIRLTIEECANLCAEVENDTGSRNPTPAATCIARILALLGDAPAEPPLDLEELP